MAFVKKLIEVALPLREIDAESSREKSIRHGHPSTLHLWWGRQQLSTARAVLWASLVDDPSGHPELFPTEEDQRTERNRLFGILTKLIFWENSNNQEVLAEAREEILKSVGGNLPVLLDPFAGGGTIPLEAQRLGLETCAYDLNPVAVMITKAITEIPPRFANQAPVNPEAGLREGWKGTAGLAEDVRYYGELLKEKAYDKVGKHYPKVKVPGSDRDATVIAWLWTRTVKCPNPVCGCVIPCMGTQVLAKKKGKNAWLVPVPEEDHFRFDVNTGETLPALPVTKKSRGAAFVCPGCGQITLDSYVKEESRAGRLGSQMTAVVADSDHGRIYLPVDAEQYECAAVEKPDDYPSGFMPDNPRWFSPPGFGMTEYADLYSNRQLLMLTAFSDLISEVIEAAEKDAVEAGLPDDHVGIAEKGKGARAYSEAIGTYLALMVDKMLDYHSTICSWHNSKELIRNTFNRQAIAMTWDYAECNPFSSSAGCFDSMVDWVCKAIKGLPGDAKAGVSKQHDSQTDCEMRDCMISTDPPYYDHIDYADLSDYFYVWMRKSLKNIYPKVFRTMMTPKAEELVANSYRFDGSVAAANEFFDDGMLKTCRQLWQYAREDVPVTVYYTFRRGESNGKEQSVSAGWETMLAMLIRAGFTITGTWPIRDEMGTAVLSEEMDVMASSFILVCRKRSASAGSVTQREFMNMLHREMRVALDALQAANVSPVDLTQSAIGPGMSVFSRYQQVVEADGSVMSVQDALGIVKQELYTYYAEQEGELDHKSRFCMDLFEMNGYNAVRKSDAELLAKAKKTTLQEMMGMGVLEVSDDSVYLRSREMIPELVDAKEKCFWKITQQLICALEQGGVKKCAEVIGLLKGNVSESAKALAYRLYTICERKNWVSEGFAYNHLIVAWPDIQAEAAKLDLIDKEQVPMNI